MAILYSNLYGFKGRHNIPARTHLTKHFLILIIKETIGRRYVQKMMTFV